MIMGLTIHISHICGLFHARRRALAIALCLVAGVCSGCSKRQPAQPSAAGAEAKAATQAPAAKGGEKAAKASPLANAHATIRGGEIVVADPVGKRLWRASADSIESDYDKQEAVLHNVSCQFEENGTEALEARAPLVTANLKDRRVVLSGGVTARAPATRTFLRADRIEWMVKDKELSATGNVKYVRGDFMLTGDRLRADLALKHARVIGRVQMQAVEPFKSK